MQLPGALNFQEAARFREESFKANPADLLRVDLDWGALFCLHGLRVISAAEREEDPRNS